MHNVRFIAGLSNGETITEEKGDFCTITGELSPWQRLLSHLKEAGATITSLSLATADGHRWNLPSAGKNPKFKAFAEAPKPYAYKFFRKYGVDQSGPNAGKEEHFSCIEALYPDGRKLQLWVSEQSLAAWTLIL